MLVGICYHDVSGRAAIAGASDWSQIAHPAILDRLEGLFLPYYRLYHVRHGRFARTDELEAHDDVAEVRQARELLEEDPAELWFGERKVTTFNSFETPS